MWIGERRSDTGNNSDDWNHFKITQTIPKQRTEKARNQRTAKKQPYWALHMYYGKC